MSAGDLVSLWDMLQLPIGQLLKHAQTLAVFAQAISLSPGKPMPMSNDTYDGLRAASAGLEDCCADIGFVVTQRIASLARNEIESAIDQGGNASFTAERARRLQTTLSSLAQCLRNEAETKLALILTPENAALFDPAGPLFGAEVASGFPSLYYDIEEGGKCLGLGRSTASAFHFIRCLEGGITALCRCLAVPEPTKGAERNWGVRLAKLDGAIRAKWPDAAAKFSGDGQFFEEAHAALSGMQNPYRNATMHLDQKYTPDEAAHIMALVKGFLMKLALRMDEDGLPLA